MTGSRPAAADASPEELIRRAARGDLAAFARIVRLHHEDMTRVAFIITGELDSAARATEVAWSVAWHGLGHKRTPEGLGPWLCSLAATEAIMVAMCDNAPGTAGAAAKAEPAGHPGGHPPDRRIEAALARLDPGDRALLALRHVAGLSMSDLTRLNRRSKPSVPARLERATAEVAGSHPPGSDPDMVERRVVQRLLAYVSVPVRPVDSDAASRRARAGEALDRTRLVSVAISVVVGALVAGLPYLAMLFHRR
jgi:RNA polymerase sigma-70 factor, ECF subfamily